MSVLLANDYVKEEFMMRDIYCETLLDIAKKDERIVTLDADLMNSIGMKAFQKEFPDRTINCGVQEANMIGVAAGLSATGKVPFAHSFGPFATRRCYDQIFISAAYAKLNVRIVGSDPGITAAYNGGTHMPFEDMGILRNIPSITLIEPVDSAMLKNILQQIVNLYGVYYIRLMRKNAIRIYEDGSAFEIGKAVKIREGKDLTIISSGVLVAESIEAAKKLEAKGISAGILNMFTWKPIDKQAVIECAKTTGAVLTAENHNIYNGLGSAVAEVLGENIPVPLERVGCLDKFGEVGLENDLKVIFKMTADDIVKKAVKLLARKKA